MVGLYHKSALDYSNANNEISVWRQLAVMGENGKTFFHRLRNKHPVKGIVMVRRKTGHCLRMGETDRHSVLLLYRHARPVAYVLAGAGERVEERRLSAVRVAREGDLDISHS